MHRLLRHARLQTFVIVLAAAGMGLSGLAPASATNASSKAASAALTASKCAAVTWGSLPKSRSSLDKGTVHDVRAGRHACFDRLVIVMDGRMSSSAYVVRYVNRVRDDSGAVVPLRGGAIIEVALSGYRFHPEDRANVDVDGFRTFRQVESGSGNSETTTFGLGVRARLPFRVFVLDGGNTAPREDSSRVVVDVAHQW